MVLGTEKFEEVEDPADRAKMLKAVEVDPARIRCLHGSAVLSRYPIREAKLVPFKDQGYDWFKGEQNIGAIEKGKRTAAILVGEKLTREIRRGGRTNLIVTLDIPDLREGVLTVADTHLENRADPEDRRNQGKELLALLKPIRNPIVIAGDLNTTGSKGLPRGMVQTVKDKMGESSFWISQGVKYGTGFGAVYGVLVGGYKQLRFQSDPTTPGVKFVAENPEAATFDVLENFRFADGRAIDFRGDAAHTVNGTSGTLADSNQRAGKGFAATFQFERTIGAKGKFKLDWIFVKSYINDPREEKQPYIFAPLFARRMFDVDYALKERMSDHTPISVDLPFTEPQVK
jgi:hypothetical protein